MCAHSILFLLKAIYGLLMMNAHVVPTYLFKKPSQGNSVPNWNVFVCYACAPESKIVSGHYTARKWFYNEQDHSRLLKNIFFLKDIPSSPCNFFALLCYFQYWVVKTMVHFLEEIKEEIQKRVHYALSRQDISQKALKSYREYAMMRLVLHHDFIFSEKIHNVLLHSDSSRKEICAIRKAFRLLLYFLS